MKTYWGSGGIAPRSLDLGTGWRWVVSRSGRFTPRELSPGTHWIGGWLGPRAVLDAVVKRKIPNPRRESNPRTPIVQPVAQRYTDWDITALLEYQILSKSIHWFRRWNVWTDRQALCLKCVHRTHKELWRRVYLGQGLLGYDPTRRHNPEDLGLETSPPWKPQNYTFQTICWIVQVGELPLLCRQWIHSIVASFLNLSCIYVRR
jgi:hypothetical protein